MEQLLEVLDLLEQLFLCPAVLPPAFLPFDVLQVARQRVEAFADLVAASHKVLEALPPLRDSLLYLDGPPHHEVEVVVDAVLLPGDFSPHCGRVRNHPALQCLDSFVQLSDLLFLVSGCFVEVGQNTLSKGRYVLLRLFFWLSSWKLFSKSPSISALKEASGSMHYYLNTDGRYMQQQHSVHTE